MAELHDFAIKSYSRNHIDIIVQYTRLGDWRLTGFYGHPKVTRRRTSWNLIRNLFENSNLPWCILGDFNDILAAEEKKGRVERQNWLISGFRQAIQDVGLVDVPTEGYFFTWFKSLRTDRVVEEKLDGAISNSDWSMLFQEAKVKRLTVSTSDHYPILLCCEVNSMQDRPHKGFKFENYWLTEPEFNNFVMEQWHKDENENIIDKLENYGESMMK